MVSMVKPSEIFRTMEFIHFIFLVAVFTHFDLIILIFDLAIKSLIVPSVPLLIVLFIQHAVEEIEHANQMPPTKSVKVQVMFDMLDDSVYVPLYMIQDVQDWYTHILIMIYLEC